MRQNGFGIMQSYLSIKGLYFPKTLPKFSLTIRCIWETLDFICLPPSITEIADWGFSYDMLHATLYVEAGSQTEKLLKTRNYPYTVKNGLPKVDGKTIEPCEHFVIWVEESEDEEKRKFLVKYFVPVRKSKAPPVTCEKKEEPCAVLEKRKEANRFLLLKNKFFNKKLSFNRESDITKMSFGFLFMSIFVFLLACFL